MKKVRSFGSFDDLRVPDIDGYSNEETGSYNSDSDSFSGGGYVQDVSPFDRILLAAWEDRFAAGLFRYDVTACKTKVVPGGYGFVAQFNEGRATKKRPTEFAVDQLFNPSTAASLTLPRRTRLRFYSRLSAGPGT
jgi:GDP-L-galactose phosphorylase